MEVCFLGNGNLTMLTDFYELTMANGYLAAYARLLGPRMESPSVSVGARNGQTEHEPSSSARPRWEG